MKLNKTAKNILLFFGNHFLFRIISLLCATLRVKVLNEHHIKSLQNEKKRYVAAFWHSTMLCPWYYFRNENLLGITSQSKDGDLLAKTLKFWNYSVVRGSSSKGGEVALGIMVDFAKNEGSIAVTPDGPRGPINKFKAGAVITAKKSCIPLFLMGTAYQNKICLKSWDRLEIPKPFSKVRIVFSEPIVVPSNLTYDETSKVIQQCEDELNQLQIEAQKFD